MVSYLRNINRNLGIPGWAGRVDHRFLLFFENHAVLHGCPSMKFELVKRTREQ